jgi:hypothetical protein
MTMRDPGHLLPMTIPVPVAGMIVGLSRNAAYAAATRGEIPTLKFGRRIVVPVGLLSRLLGLEVLPAASLNEAAKGSITKDTPLQADPPLTEVTAKTRNRIGVLPATGEAETHLQATDLLNEFRYKSGISGG